MKDFTTEQVERHAGIDPRTLQFKLGGQTLQRLPSFSPYLVTEFQGLETPTMEDTMSYIKSMIDPKSHAAFDKAIKEGEPRPTMDTLMEIISWLMEQATSRPTSPPSSSTAGPSRTGTTSTEDSPSLVGAI